MNKLKKIISTMLALGIMVGMISVVVYADSQVTIVFLDKQVTISKKNSYVSSKAVDFKKRVTHRHNLTVENIGATGTLKDTYKIKSTKGVYTSASTYSLNVVVSNKRRTYGYTVGPCSVGTYQCELWTNDTCVITPSKLIDTYQ